MHVSADENCTQCRRKLEVTRSDTLTRTGAALSQAQSSPPFVVRRLTSSSTGEGWCIGALALSRAETFVQCQSCYASRRFANRLDTANAPNTTNTVPTTNSVRVGLFEPPVSGSWPCDVLGAVVSAVVVLPAVAVVATVAVVSASDVAVVPAVATASVVAVVPVVAVVSASDVAVVPVVAVVSASTVAVVPAVAVVSTSAVAVVSASVVAVAVTCSTGREALVAPTAAACIRPKTNAANVIMVPTNAARRIQASSRMVSDRTARASTRLPKQHVDQARQKVRVGRARRKRQTRKAFVLLIPNEKPSQPQRQLPAERRQDDKGGTQLIDAEGLH